jgi:hypothetical protein
MRFVTGIVAIGIGSAALALSTANSLQLLKLNNEVKTLTHSLVTLDTIASFHTAQLLHLNQCQLQLALALNHTQDALNQTINLANQHSATLSRHDAAIENLAIYARGLNKKINTFISLTEMHFLETSVSDIIAQRLNLDFVHHRDLPRVLNYIISTTNVSFHESTELPLFELVTRLLLQQRINFVPRSKNSQAPTSCIGFLSISSFFAASTNTRPPFSVYELLPIPFPYGNTRVRLADMPQLIGIDFVHKHLIQWTQSESLMCNFRAMTVCRETPPVITYWNDTCLFQILTDSTLTNCRIELYHEVSSFIVSATTGSSREIKHTNATLPQFLLITRRMFFRIIYAPYHL